MTTLTVVSIALLGSLLFLLGANVTRHRAQRGSTGNQMPSDPADRLLIAIRAHGNAAEYVPMLCILILACAALTSGWWLNTLMVGAVVFRVMHAADMLTGPSLASHRLARDIGAAGTYATGIALAVTAVASL